MSGDIDRKRKEKNYFHEMIFFEKNDSSVCYLFIAIIDKNVSLRRLVYSNNNLHYTDDNGIARYIEINGQFNRNV